MYFLEVPDNEDDVTDLWEEVRGDRPLPPPPAPKAQRQPKAHVRSRTRPARPGQGWLFATADTEDGLTVVFTPVEYWEREGAAYDQELPENIKRILPNYLEEVMESTCVADVREGDLRFDLVSLGFREDAGFTQWVQGARAMDDFEDA